MRENTQKDVRLVTGIICCIVFLFGVNNIINQGITVFSVIGTIGFLLFAIACFIKLPVLVICGGACLLIQELPAITGMITLYSYGEIPIYELVQPFFVAIARISIIMIGVTPKTSVQFGIVACIEEILGLLVGCLFGYYTSTNYILLVTISAFVIRSILFLMLGLGFGRSKKRKGSIQRTPSHSIDNTVERLAELKQLYDGGYISMSEFQKKKREIMEEL